MVAWCVGVVRSFVRSFVLVVAVRVVVVGFRLLLLSSLNLHSLPRTISYTWVLCLCWICTVID